MISLIVAMSENGVIGRDNKLPWHIPADMERFKRLTWGNTVIMGRKTHESIGKPLPGRQNIILTNQTGYKAKGCEIAHNIEQAVGLAKQSIFVIGGAQIYQLFMPLVTKIHLTVVPTKIEGDAFFDFDRKVFVLSGGITFIFGPKGQEICNFSTYTKKDFLYGKC